MGAGWPDERPPAPFSPLKALAFRAVLRQSDSDRRPAGVRVLEAQPDLLQGVDEEQRQFAHKHLVAVLDCVDPGPWDPIHKYEESPAGLGLLVIDGMLARDLRIGGRACAELLGPGDLLRPWDYDDGLDATLQSASAWTVLEPARIALLDERFARMACRWPQLVAGLLSRSMRRSRWMAILLAISNLTRVDERIEALMWHLADRWGHVTRAGVVVPVPLTHELIGKLVGAHRPSVTSALGELQRSGVLTREESHWLLHGQPPERLRLDNGSGKSARGISIDPTLVATLPALVAGLFF